MCSLGRLMQLTSPSTCKEVRWHISQRHLCNQVKNGRTSTKNADVTNKTTVTLTFSLVQELSVEIFPMYIGFA